MYRFRRREYKWKCETCGTPANYLDVNHECGKCSQKRKEEGKK